MWKRMLAMVALGLGFAAGASVAQQAPQEGRPQVMLSRLVGTWDFEMFIPGRDHPFGKGRREIRLMQDSMKLSWVDDYEGSEASGAGFLGYDERLQTYYLMGVYTGHSTPIFFLGSATADTIHFDAGTATEVYTNPPGTYVLSELHLLAPDRFDWVMNNDGWRARFTRAPEP